MAALVPPLPDRVSIRVLVIVHDPVLQSQGGRTLREQFRWNDPDALARAYIDDVRDCSHGYANYSIVDRIVVDGLPQKADGFRYDDRSYLRASRSGRFHQPDTMDYRLLVERLRLAERISDREIDEVWMFGPPYAGYYESLMAGPAAFWCNAPPLQNVRGCARRFVMMGFSYERGVGEMLENLGHRAESILGHVFDQRAGAGVGANFWDRFTRYDLTHPGQAECGNVHFAPNSQADYDWGNRRPVPSTCDNWYRFPDLAGQPRMVDAREWGGGDIRAHHRWWLRHFPHWAGVDGGISWNWWEYVIDPNQANP